MQGIGGTGFCLVWAGRIENPHEEVTVNALVRSGRVILKPGFVSMPLAFNEITGICGIPARSKARRIKPM